VAASIPLISVTYTYFTNLEIATRYPVAIIMRGKDVVNKFSFDRCVPLVVPGDSDQLVPPAHMRKLYDLAAKSTLRQFYSVLHGTHNDTWELGGEEYYLVRGCAGILPPSYFSFYINTHSA